MPTTLHGPGRPIALVLLTAALAACGGGGGGADDPGAPDPTGCETLASTTITAAVTLGQSCYDVDASISVDNGGALTVSAGTTLRFASGTRLTVRQGGSLATLGTAARPVTLTGQDKTPGAWEGVRFVFSNSSANQLTHTVIEYGGAGSEAAILAATGLTTSLARLKLDAVTLRHSSHGGFAFDESTQLDTLNQLTVTDNAWPGLLPANLVGQLGTTSRFGGNADDAIRVDSTDVTTAQTWQRQDVPYHLLDTSALYRVQAPLTIAPGVTLKMAAGSAFYVQQAGSLKAAGSAELPILFTGEQATAGFWKGIEFVFSNSVENELSHAVVEYAGASTRDAAVSLLSLSTSPSRVKLANLVLRHSSSGGFGFDELALVDRFEAVTSTANAHAGYASANGASVLGSDSAYTGNTQDVVRLNADTEIGRAQTWQSLDVPYLLPDTGNYLVTGALTIQAGTRLVMGSGSAFYVQQTGSLNAVGTAAAPIRMSGAQPTAGYWRGVQLIFSNSSDNVMDHVLLTDAGAGTASSTGAVYMLSLSTSPARLTLTNSTVSNSASWAVYRDEDSLLTTSGNTYTGNASGPVGP